MRGEERIFVFLLTNELYHRSDIDCLRRPFHSYSSYLFEQFTLSMLGKKKTADDILKYVSRKTGFGISFKLCPPYETICMKCQSLFSRKNKKNIINLLSAEFVKKVARSTYLS